MHWDVDGRSQKVMKEIAAAVKGADKLILATDPDREGEAISWHILRILEERKALKKGVPVERVTFNAVTKQSVLDAFKAPRADRRAAGRGLPRPPGARLPRGLHPVAGAVAQAAGRPLGRPRAVGGAAPRVRPRGRDRGLQDRRILDHRGPARHPEGRGVPARLIRHRRPEARQARPQGRGLGHRHQGGHREGRLQGRARREEGGEAQSRSRPSPPRPCRWTPRASSASRPSRPCSSPSASTRASTSAARRSASSPTCEPTASPSSRRRSTPSAG